MLALAIRSFAVGLKVAGCSGRRGVLVVRKAERNVVLGSRRPEELAEAIQEAIAVSLEAGLVLVIHGGAFVALAGAFALDAAFEDGG